MWRLTRSSDIAHGRRRFNGYGFLLRLLAGRERASIVVVCANRSSTFCCGGAKPFPEADFIRPAGQQAYDVVPSLPV